MTDFSKVEFNPDSRGFLEETSLVELTYDSTIYGFVRTVTLILGNPNRHEPILTTAVHDGGDNNTTTAEDADADFFAGLVRQGDVVVNIDDDPEAVAGQGTARWEVTSVAKSILSIRLVTGGGGDDDFDDNDDFEVRRRNLEDLYVPFKTELRITSRDNDKVLFRGEVQEAIALDEQGRFLKVLAVSWESELRDGASVTDQATLPKSGVIQDVIDEKGTGTFLFPRISSFEGMPGIEHSPNLQTVTPDFSKTARSALASFIDMAKTEDWCPDTMREPSNPIVSFTSDD